MEFNIPTGITGSQEITVSKPDTASHYGSGLIDVFATPAMVALMEKTAQLSVQPFLPAGAITLGTGLCISHVKATAIGSVVRCSSVLEKSEGRKLLFHVSAYDDQGLIGEGTHRRSIVDRDKFLEKFLQNG